MTATRMGSLLPATRSIRIGIVGSRQVEGLLCQDRIVHNEAVRAVEAHETHHERILECQKPDVDDPSLAVRLADHARIQQDHLCHWTYILCLAMGRAQVELPHPIEG